MRDVLGSRGNHEAQTLVFFLLAFGLIMLLCGLAIDSGLLFLAKARLARAVDGAALVAVGNFHRSDNADSNRAQVAVIMRNFAVANYTDLGSGPNGGISSSATPTSTTYTLPSGGTGTTYTYSFNDGLQDANGQYKRFVEVTLNTGSSGAITSAICNARCPVQTFFIGYAMGTIGGYNGIKGLSDLKVSSSATATRNPRLIMIVIDRSASMLNANGGAYGLPPAIVTFLNFFDTSSDNIGIVSFGSSARLEMPMTTNFLIAGTNNLIDAYQIDGSSGVGEPGLDPEQLSTNSRYDPNYATTGIRRLKFGGQTAADDGIRLGMEQLMANGGFNDPDVIKYLVIFTDGKWNVSRTLFAAPPYTNSVYAPGTNLPPYAGPGETPAHQNTNYVDNAQADSMTTNGQTTYYINGATNGPWDTVVANDANLIAMPLMSPLHDMTNAILDTDPANNFANVAPNHFHDTWQSSDGNYEPLNSSGTGGSGDTIVGGVTSSTNNYVSTNTYLETVTDASGSTNYCTHNVDIWLQPGSVAYLYSTNNANPPNTQQLTNNGTFVSDYTFPQKHINVYLNPGDRVDLVVPGYVVDGLAYDGLDLTYPANPDYGINTYPCYRIDNYNQTEMWPDEVQNTSVSPFNSLSLMRELMFRNYVNLLTGFTVYRADDPLGSGYEKLITENALNSPPGAQRPLYGLGIYYPATPFYWPFDGVGIDPSDTYCLSNALVSPHQNGRHSAYSINMLSTNAAPEWAGEWFYRSSSGGGTNSVSGNGTSSASQLMQASDWQNGAPSWLQADFANANPPLMVTDTVHNTNIGTVGNWRPITFNGSNDLLGTTPGVCAVGQSVTGGFVSDGNNHYYGNAMAWTGRPTHYYDFTKASWEPIPDNHTKNNYFLQMGNWKAYEYCWHARAMGVTIYTVGFGSLVTDAQQAYLAQLANATNTTAGGGTNITYNPTQPIGAQFFGTNSTDISNDFYAVGQAINAALTQ